MKNKLLVIITSLVMLFTLPGCADSPALRDLGTFDPQILKSLTWNEGTGFYDYVLFSYDNTDLPFESYTISAVLPDMTPALSFPAGESTLAVEPCIMAWEDIALPVLSLSVSDTDVMISRARLSTGEITLLMDFSAGGEFVYVDEETGASQAHAINIGSNLFTLIGALAENGAFLSCSLTLQDGTVLEGNTEKVTEEEKNPFRWLDLCLKEARLLDESGRLQESLRLFAAQFPLHFDLLPEITLTGAEWISDLDGTVAAYPMKLEYAHEMEGDAFTVGILNYSGAFGSRSIRSSSSVRLVYYCLDQEGAVLPFADGSVFRFEDFFCALGPCESTLLSFNVPLPADTDTVRAAIASVTWSEGAVQTVPDRDLVFVDYTPQTLIPETAPQDDAVSL